MAKPDLIQTPAYFLKYINLVPQDNIMEAFKNQASHFVTFLQSIPAHKYLHRYQPEKWSLQELILHIIDTERIFAYRALCIARKEPNSLLGFDENVYAANSKADNRNWENLINEFSVVRSSTEFLFQSFDENQLRTVGLSNSQQISAISIGFILVGHVLHHEAIIKSRYL